MALHRTYVCKMPSMAGQMPFLDILVGGIFPVGSKSRPIKQLAGVPDPSFTPGPPGWQVFDGVIDSVIGDGLFFEWRGRQLAVTGVPPFCLLGWKTTLYCVGGLADGCLATPCVQHSTSFLGVIPNPQFASVNLPDQIYGFPRAVIRLINSPDVQGGIFVVHFDVFGFRDEDNQQGNM